MARGWGRRREKARLFVGPVLNREVVTAPRRARFYVARALYPLALLVLASAAWQVLTGTQAVRNVGDFALFGATVFQVLAPLQMALAIFFAALQAASGVAQEKDRRTLLLLLVTRLTNAELVLGKLLASLLGMAVLLAAGVPVLMLLVLFGGTSPAQVGRVVVVTAAAALVSASLGSTIALWREKTFQSLALTALALVAWLSIWEAVHLGLVGTHLAGIPCESLATAMSPWQAVLAAARPAFELSQATTGTAGESPYLPTNEVLYFIVCAAGAAIVLNAVAIARVRVWNPSREVQPRTEAEESRAGRWSRETEVAQLETLAAAAAASPGAPVPETTLPATAPDAIAPPKTAPEETPPATAEHAAVPRDVAVEAGANHTTATRATAVREAAAREAASRERLVREKLHLDRVVPERVPREGATPWRWLVDWRTARRPPRRVWDNPILWREVRTAAYGRRTLAIRGAYVLLFVLAAWVLASATASPEGLTRATAMLALVPLFLLSLVLINAQAVTSLTSERDSRAIDLLLVTDLTPREVVFGKLGGVFYNSKESVLLPLGLCLALWWYGQVSFENTLYVCLGLLVMDVFVATLGLHAGMIYPNSRTAVAVSLGTVFFLFIGVATCMRVMVAFSGSFAVQLQPFLAFMVGGGVGMYWALGMRNPSPALFLASMLCPFATFYAITSFLLEGTLIVLLVMLATYGFATAAMLVPAIYEFDVATGRTTVADD